MKLDFTDDTFNLFFSKDKKGNIYSHSFPSLRLRRGIKEVRPFGKILLNFLKYRGLPFEYKKMHLEYRIYEDFDYTVELNKGNLVITLGKKTWRSRLNPFHRTCFGDETIIIEWNKGGLTLFFYQEQKGGGGRFSPTLTWKISKTELVDFINLLHDFAEQDEVGKLIYVIE